jgi:FtsP/CotA-like multicopper oxidase with cupredoxin domain
VPIIPHVHGGHTDFLYDGNAENFFTAKSAIVGPQWTGNLLPDGSIPPFAYENSQNAALIWYHDHTLGITRLNVYSGMAGFYVIRDIFDTGLNGNPLTLPTYPYETALAIQDRMFKGNGDLFYPAFPGDPGYVNFIANPASVPKPTALAEFFG